MNNYEHETDEEFIREMRALVNDPARRSFVCWCPRCQPWREVLNRLERARRQIERLNWENAR